MSFRRMLAEEPTGNLRRCGSEQGAGRQKIDGVVRSEKLQKIIA